jgi:hypothetical protein
MTGTVVFLYKEGAMGRGRPKAKPVVCPERARLLQGVDAAAVCSAGVGAPSADRTLESNLPLAAPCSRCVQDKRSGGRTDYEWHGTTSLLSAFL